MKYVLGWVTISVVWELNLQIQIIYTLRFIFKVTDISSSSQTAQFPFITKNRASSPNNNNSTVPLHHPNLPINHPSSLRPPNFEQLMLLHHAQQQHKLQQHLSRQNESRYDNISKTMHVDIGRFIKRLWLVDFNYDMH